MPPPRLHPLARAPVIDRLNGWLSKAWDKGWLDLPPLTADAIWAKAARGFETADEFGGRSAEDAADFRIRLTRLCDAIADEAQLNPLGQCMAHGQMVRAVRHRLALGRLWLSRPDILGTDLPAPIIIAGQMRSGTTRIHRLLAADPALSATRFCDSWHPVPRRPDMRPIKGMITLALARWLDPWIDSIHPFGAAQGDEELGWLATALDHSAYEAQWHIPAFVRWSEAQDPAPIYREFARMLRSDAAHHGNAARPRILKVPQFTEDLPSLLAQFPGASLITTQRDDDEVQQSSVSLVANQMTIQSDDVDLAQIEDEWRRKLALREARMQAALSSFSGPAIKLDYETLNADWRSAIANAYQALDMDLSENAKRAMEHVQAKAGKGAHHHHAASYQTSQPAHSSAQS